MENDHMSLSTHNRDFKLVHRANFIKSINSRGQLSYFQLINFNRSISNHKLYSTRADTSLTYMK